MNASPGKLPCKTLSAPAATALALGRQQLRVCAAGARPGSLRPLRMRLWLHHQDTDGLARTRTTACGMHLSQADVMTRPPLSPPSRLFEGH